MSAVRKNERKSGGGRRFAASRQELPDILGWVKERSEELLPLPQALRLQLAAEEALLNIIAHGYADAAGEPYVQADFWLCEGEVTLELEDAGAAFNPLQPPSVPAPDTALAERQAGGWGLVMLRRFTDAVSYERRGAKNILRMTWRREAAKEK